MLLSLPILPGNVAGHSSLEAVVGYPSQSQLNTVSELMDDPVKHCGEKSRGWQCGTVLLPYPETFLSPFLEAEDSSESDLFHLCVSLSEIAFFLPDMLDFC